MRALVVEDNVAQLNGLAEIIEESFPDIECLKAACYDDALALADSHSIQLFLLDIQLGADPDKDGIKLGEQLRRNPRYQTTPILYVTALVNEAPRAIHKTNCYDYLVKPYSQQDLIESVSKLLNFSLIREEPIELTDRDGVLARIRPDNILYIKSELRNMHVHTTTGLFISTGTRLSVFADSLPSYFARCHKSFVVNLPPWYRLTHRTINGYRLAANTPQSLVTDLKLPRLRANTLNRLNNDKGYLKC